MFSRQNKYSSRQKLHLTINRIPEKKKNILYLALTKKECLRGNRGNKGEEG